MLVSRMHVAKWPLTVISTILLSFVDSLDLGENRKSCDNGNPTILVKTARGQLGNHLWLLMTMLNYELRYNIKAYITEDTRWILDKHFKGKQQNHLPSPFFV